MPHFSVAWPAPAPPTKEPEPPVEAPKAPAAAKAPVEPDAAPAAEPTAEEPPAAPTKETEQTPEQRAACLGACDGVLKYLLRHKHAAWFADPVDPVGMGIPHYAEVIKTPMDFGTIKSKLKEQRYGCIQEFMEDMELVFYNCKLYNGEVSGVGQMGKQVHEEYIKLVEQLCFDFYQM